MVMNMPELINLKRQLRNDWECAGYNDNGGSNWSGEHDDDNTGDDEDEATQCTPLHSKCCVKQLQSQLALVATNTFSCPRHDDDDDDDGMRPFYLRPFYLPSLLPTGSR